MFLINFPELFEWQQRSHIMIHSQTNEEKQHIELFHKQNAGFPAFLLKL